MRTSVLIAVACLSLTALTTAAEVRAAIRKATSIPAQGLGPALHSLARQRDLQVVYLSDAVDPLRTSGAVGELTTDEALVKLLDGTGLAYRYLDEKTVMVFSAAPGSTDSAALSEHEQAGAPGDRQGRSFWDRFRLAQVDERAAASDGSVEQQQNRKPAALIEEIVVTAQKRAEDVQDVPVSMSVIDVEQIERLGATQLTDFAGYVPGFSVSNFGTPGQNQLVLRGVSTGDRSTRTVGTYVDDIPLGSSTSYQQAGRFAFDLLPYDIINIQVLRGPQGTLYGASTLGGLLKYTTRSPDLNAFELRAGTGVSRTSEADDAGWSARGAINVPLVTGKFALRASVFNQETAGFIDNPVRGESAVDAGLQRGGRLALSAQPTEDLTLNFAAMVQRTEADSRSGVYLLGSAPASGALQRSNAVAEPYEQDAELFTLTVDWQLGWADFTAASGFSHTDTSNPADLSAGLSPLLQNFLGLSTLVHATAEFDVEKFTQELRLTSPSGGKLEWLVGAFYADETGKNVQQYRALSPATQMPITGIDPLVHTELPSEYRELAIFGDATYDFTDSFDVTVGLRWAENRQEFATVIHDTLLAGILLPPAGVSPGKSREDVVTYMVSPRFHVNDDTMIYGRVATGYRAGGPNVPQPGISATFDADTLINYELGMKAQLFERRMSVDLALFRIDWNDVQIVVVDPVTGNSGKGNGGTAVSQGAELSFDLRPIDGLTLGISASYTDATLSDPIADVDGDRGERLPNTPRWSGALTADYEFPLTGIWTASLGAGYRYVGERNESFPGDSGAFVLDSYGVVDLNASVTNDRWIARIFARNVGDERAYLSASHLPPFFEAAVLRPRTVGLSLDVKF